MRSVEPATPAEELLLDLLSRRTGIRLTEALRAEALRVGHERARAQGQDLEGWVSALGAAGASPELELVTRALTVGETYFFRGPVFEVLRRAVLPQLVAKKRAQGSSVVRLASVGCATGEEAYSLALLLNEAIAERARWNLGVLGLDLNAAFLERAECADFNAWSFRGSEPAAWSPWLRSVGEQWTVHPTIRALVRFEQVNLASDPLPAPALGLVGLDLALCQNVLIYFERSVRARVVRGLAQTLAPGGLLFFGPSDLVVQEVPGCEAVAFGDLIGFRRVEPPAAARRRPSGAALRAITTLPSPLAHDARPAQPAPSAAAEGAAAPATFERARELADQGEVVLALEELEVVVAAGGDDPRPHTLQGLLLTDVGAPLLALDAFRRAIYLAPDALLPHLGAFIAARRLADPPLVRRYGARTRALARALPLEASVQGWEGMTARRVLELVERTEEPR